MPPLTMSFRWMTPRARLFSATTSGVPPCLAIASMRCRSESGMEPPRCADVGLDGVGRSFAHLAAVEIDAADARLR